MTDACTKNAALLMRQEDITGSIETGKRTDVVVRDCDLFRLPAMVINEAQVLLTLLDGQVVFSRAGPGN